MISKNPYAITKWRQSVAPEKPRLAFEATTPVEARRWQRKLRRQFITRLGGFPATAVPLQAKTLDTSVQPGYRRETISFVSRKGLNVFGYFLAPDNATAGAALPALLCLHGHGPGVDPLVGLDGAGKPAAEPDYHNDFALQAVRRGYAVLAIEILGFGRRTEAGSEPGSNSCQTLSGTALMVRQTMAGWRTYDAIRALDYLQTRPEVDAARLGAMGISGGGLNALYLAAVDDRLRAAVVSGFLNTFRDSIMSIFHCIDNFVPGMALDSEMSDIAGLVAPRALWCENGSQDDIFPAVAFKRALREVRKIYQVMGVPERCGGRVFEGGHQFDGGGAWEFLEQNL